MSIPSPYYFLAQAETVSSQTTSLHWTITRFLVSRLVNKGPVGVLCLIHIQIVVDFPLGNVGCVACPFDFLSFQEIRIDMIT